MNPYQGAAESLRNSGQTGLNLIKNAGLAAVGGGIAKVGSHAASKLIPAVSALLNNYVPDKLSQAGLERLDPRFGKFIKGAENAGYDYEEIRQFLGDKFSKAESAKENRNIIQQVSPELHQFLDQEIKKGRKPVEAGALAQNDKRFTKVINELSKKHKTPWSNIIEGIYGKGNMAMQQQQGQEAQQQPQQGQQQGLDPNLAQLMNGIRENIQKLRG